VIAVVLTGVTSPAGVLATVYLQEALDYGATRAGLTLLPFSVAVIAGSALGSVLLARRGARGTIVGGLLAITAAMGLATAIDPPGGTAYLAAALALAGLGLGAASVAATALGVAAVDAADEGLASGLLNTAAQIGTAVGIAVLLTVAAAGEGDGAGAEAMAQGIRLGYAVACAIAAVTVALAIAFVRTSVVTDGKR
jgi:MFS family permease